MNRSDSIAKLAVALVAAKKQFRPALRDSENPHFKSKFVSLDGVLDAIDGALLANGIVAMQPTRLGEDGKTVLVTTLLHESGEWLSGEYPVTPSQAGPQGEGSGLTYARRYALMSMVGIAPEDDDAEAATNRTQGRQRVQVPSQAPAQTASDVRTRIAGIAKAKRLSHQEVADDFASWSQGTKITDADVPSLLRYVDYLNGAAA